MGFSRHSGDLARLRSVALTLTVAMSLLGGSAYAQNATFSRSDSPFLGGDYVIADLNGDGRIDLAGTGAMTAVVMLGNGNGTFGPRREFPVATWNQNLAAGDFNNDSRLDLVVTINDPATSLSLLFGNGDGTFGAPVNFPNTSGADSPTIVATDLDNDAWLDLVIGHDFACFTAPCRVAESITVMLGNGDGTFQPPNEIVVGSGTAKIAVGDFNRDGQKDLALASSSSRVHILIGAGDGTFSSQTTLTLTADTFGVQATDVDVADLNRDGIQDVVVAVATNGSRTAILIGRGDGTFAPPLIITEPAIRIPQYQAIADYNGDGFQDLALSLGWGSQGLFEILNGRGDGTFGAPVLYLAPPDRSSISGGQIATGDFNGDNKPDLALGITGAFPAFTALTNTTGAAPPATPSAPTLLSPAQDSRPSQPVTFDWTDVNGATAYQIQVDDSSDFSTPRVIDRIVTPSTFTSTNTPFGARLHWWRVRGINSAGTAGAWSSVRRFTPLSQTAAPASLSAVSVSPSSVTGGTPTQGTVSLTSAAPTGGIAVSLASNNVAASVPASVTIAQGQTSATFQVTTSAVSGSTAVTITASAAGVTRTTTLTVNPPAQQATLTVTATGRSGERVTSTPTGINVSVGSSGSATFSTGTSIRLSVSNSRDAIWSGACSSGGSKTKTCTFTLNGNASVNANVQ